MYIIKTMISIIERIVIVAGAIATILAYLYR